MVKTRKGKLCFDEFIVSLEQACLLEFCQEGSSSEDGLEFLEDAIQKLREKEERVV